MKKKVQVIIFAVIFFGISLTAWVSPDKEYSEAERRLLAKMPQISLESIVDGSFEEGFEKYTTDQFPLRDQFRTVKALFEYKVFGKKDNNDLYEADGHVAQILWPYNAGSVTNATDKFGSIYENLIAGTASEDKVYVSVIPDKGYYMAEASGRPVIDYEQMFSQVKEEMDYAKYIDITKDLELRSYYTTDLHWKQENILPVTEVIGQAMGLESAGKADRLEQVEAKPDFRGVYYGQSALPLPAEPIYYLTNDVIEGAVTFNFETNQEGKVYDLDGLNGKDPYDVYLSGPTPLLTIENPAAETDRQLVIFRDSFGSSLAPLLIEDYAKITLVDIRYIQSGFLGQFIEFDGQDVLFIYGTTILNDSSLLK
ncbi:MAG: hypothetical protein IJB73_05235 [Firmicutes bacterium]|nr:hypothetical protein [Bacillota bacterium]